MLDATENPALFYCFQIRHSPKHQDSMNLEQLHEAESMYYSKKIKSVTQDRTPAVIGSLS